MRTAGGVMIGAGIGTAIVGGLLAGVGRAMANDSWSDIFPTAVTLSDGTVLRKGDSSVRDAESSYYGWSRDIAAAGTGIVIGGGTVAIAGIPLTVEGHRRATATGLHREARPGARKKKRSKKKD